MKQLSPQKPQVEYSSPKSPLPISESSTRQDWLDWLRGVAIFMVLGAHYQLNWKEAGLFLPWAAFNMRVGWTGVDLFFVVSGFLVGGLLLSEHAKYDTLDLKRFYQRRATKIWPLLYLVAIAYIPYAMFFFKREPLDIIKSIIPIFFHVQNYFPMQLSLTHLWSLAVEEHFYLGLPALILFSAWTARRSKINLPIILITLITAFATFRIVSVFVFHPDPRWVRIATHYRIDGLLFGVLLAWVYRYHRSLWTKIAQNKLYWALGLFLWFWPFLFNPNYSNLVAGPGLSSFYLGYGMLLLGTWNFSHVKKSPTLQKLLSQLAWVGRYSYPIYLFHPAIWAVFNKFGLSGALPTPALLGSVSATWILGYIVFLSTSIGLGAFIGANLEKPLLVLRNRLFPPRATALPDNAA